MSKGKSALLDFLGKWYICGDMRYVAFLYAVGAFLYAQCGACTPDANQSPTPYGFNPAVLYVRPGVDTSLTIYFTFPDEVQQGSFTVYPNYAIWVDSLKLDRGLIMAQSGMPFAYNTTNPTAGPIAFDQMHRYKRYATNPDRYANFVVYQNPGGTAGQTPPIGCARVCVKGGPTEGSDTLRVKVRAFIPTLGDGSGKDTTNLTPQLLGQNAWLDTTFRYVVVVTSTIPAALAQGRGEVARFTVLPNPAYGEAEVRFSLHGPALVSLEVYTADGRQVYGHTGLYSAGEQRPGLSLPAGLFRGGANKGPGRLSPSLVGGG